MTLTIELIQDIIKVNPYTKFHHQLCEVSKGYLGTKVVQLPSHNQFLRYAFDVVALLVNKYNNYLNDTGKSN